MRAAGAGGFGAPGGAGPPGAPGGAGVPGALLPPPWLGAARGRPGEALPRARRPWSWSELDRDDATATWALLEGFVEQLNARYVERSELRVPPCWPAHGGLVEELTSLYWLRWQAYDSAEAAPQLAHSFTAYAVLGFLEQMPRWLGADRLRRCQAGKHELRSYDEPAEQERWSCWRRDLAGLDAGLRPAQSKGAPGA